jgi:hypothetical protein
MALLTLPFVSIKPNYLTTYTHFDNTASFGSVYKSESIQPLDNRTHGLMSVKSNRNVRLAIDWMCLLSKNKHVQSDRTGAAFTFKLNFITLTLSSKQKHSDNVIKSKLLNQFLIEIKRTYGCQRYLWRAESQSNGNIHFHIVTDVFIAWRKLRTLWNRIQEKLGYVSTFTDCTGKVDPNSTDVHAIKKIKNLPSYLSKYCSKNAKGYTVMATLASPLPFRPKSFLTYRHPVFKRGAKFFRQIHGKLWGLSSNLSKLKSCRKEQSEELNRELEKLKSIRPEKVKFKDFIGVYLFDVFELAKYECFHLLGSMRDYCRSVLYPPNVVVKDYPILYHPSN